MCISLCNVGPGKQDFTLEIHHGGFFVGFGELRSYLGEKVNQFDWIETDAWSLLWFEDFLQQLGYHNDRKIKFYWLLPWKTLVDGLRVIASDHDTNVMASVSEKNKTSVMYVDHVPNREEYEWDDVVANPVADLPKVLSPHKVVYVQTKANEKLPVFYTDLKKGRVEQGGSSVEPEEDGGEQSEDGSGQFGDDEDFVDSDNEIDDEDEDCLRMLLTSMWKG